MHISYSELKTWAECAWKHKLIYIDRVNKFVGNEYTAFGRALHLLCEHAREDKIQELLKTIPSLDLFMQWEYSKILPQIFEHIPIGSISLKLPPKHLLFLKNRWKKGVR